MEAHTMQADGKKRAALGKGIESLLGPRPAAAAAADVSGKPLEIALDRIERNPQQTRATFHEAGLNELANFDPHHSNANKWQQVVEGIVTEE